MSDEIEKQTVEQVPEYSIVRRKVIYTIKLLFM